MQAIITKYLRPTNVRGARIKASCQATSIIVSWNDGLSPEDNHRAAADALCQKLDQRCVDLYGSAPSGIWTRPRVMGQLPSGEYAHVFVDGE